MLKHQCPCGETDPKKFYGHKRSTCGACHNAYTVNKGKEKRKYAVDKLGGKCVVCGFDKWIEGLDIHHRDPSIKDKNFKSMRGWSLNRILKEIKDCILLCRNCHAGHHAGHLDLPPVGSLVDR